LITLKYFDKNFDLRGIIPRRITEKC
jgi:hypothetical protein